MLERLFGLPEQASTFAAAVDYIYIFMIAVSAFFTLLVVVLVIIFSIQYRKQEGRYSQPVHGNLPLELTWTGIPLILVLVMFGWGTWVYFKQISIPVNASEIFVVGKQWMWKIQHGEGPREMNELHIPINRPIKLTMTSEDVIHSFFVPAFRAKADVVPGRYNFMWFQANKPGKYHLFCTEYCGTKHSEMVGTVYAMEEADFQKWLDQRVKEPTVALVYSDSKNSNVQGAAELNSNIVTQDMMTVANDEPLVARGQRLFKEMKCLPCHSPTSGPMGPDLAGLFGKEVHLEDGGTIRGDETYIRESILNPSDKITAGYEALMPTYKEQIDEEQILALMTYIKSLRE